MRISDWSSDVCSSDLREVERRHEIGGARKRPPGDELDGHAFRRQQRNCVAGLVDARPGALRRQALGHLAQPFGVVAEQVDVVNRLTGDHGADEPAAEKEAARSEEHTSELQSLMRISYAVFCLKKTKSRLK